MSTGVPSEQGVLDDGWRVLEWVAGQNPSSVLLIGHSLGAAVAVGAPQLSARAREDAPNRVPAMSTGIAARLCEEAAAPAVSLLSSKCVGDNMRAVFLPQRLLN